MAEFTLSERYQRCQALFDRWYPRFRNAGQRYQDIIATFTQPSTMLLDVGCGRTSLAAEPISTVHFSAGIDLNFVDLQHNDLVAYRVMADAQGLPFPAASFDLLAMQWVVEHLAHPRSVFAELARVLRPSGHIVVLTTNACNYVPIISRLTPERLHRAVIERLLHRPSHETFPTFYRANTRRHLRRLAQQTGLQLEACIYVGNPFYLTSSLQLFRMGLLFEKVTDHPALRPLKLYMIATLRKEAERAEGGGG